MNHRHLVALVSAAAAIAVALAVRQPTPVAAAGPEPATAPDFERGSPPSIVTLPFLSVVQSSSPSHAQDFTFTGCMGTSGRACDTFVLDDDSDPTVPGARTGMGLSPGTYVITQAPTADWPLMGISCSNTTSEVVDLAKRQVTVDLQAGQGVFCTFGNRTQTIRVTQNTEPNGPQDFVFTGCDESAHCSTFSLDDDTDPTLSVRSETNALPAGTYTVTQAPNAAWDLTELTCNETEVIDLARRRATITVHPGEAVYCSFTNRSQSITLVQDTAPDSGQDFGFTGCLGSGCSTFVMDDDADAALPRSITSHGLVPGTYTITQDAVPGHELTAISCPGETVDLSARRATITLGPRDDVTCTFSNRPTPPPLTGVAQLTTGDQHTCALLTTGQARCWGTNHHGQLGNGTTANSMRPVVVLDPEGSGPLTGITRLSAGWARTCALLGSGQAVCWGANSYGQLGDGTSANASLPVLVRSIDGSGPLTGIAQIDARGDQHTCAVQEDGRALCWGRNAHGQLGDGTTTDHLLPAPVVAVDGDNALTEVASLASGYLHSCALLDSGEVRCWGWNLAGELGNGTTSASPRPVVVQNAAGTGPLTGIEQISSSFVLSCGRHSDGRAWCWGQTPEGGGRSHTRPTAILAEDGTSARSDILAVEAGNLRLCVLTTDAVGRCAGAWLGSAGSNSTTIPVPVAGVGGVGTLGEVAALSGTYDHVCAQLRNGEARCWGHNFGGVLGDGTTIDRVFPVAVGDPS